MTEEYFFYCPNCAKNISMVLDLSVRGQTYIEDCEVCCNPIEIRYTVVDHEVEEFDAQATQ
jgi:transcription elongation factor Elf1